jgi:hypothetical protein
MKAGQCFAERRKAGGVLSLSGTLDTQCVHARNRIESAVPSIHKYCIEHF